MDLIRVRQRKKNKTKKGKKRKSRSLSIKMSSNAGLTDPPEGSALRATRAKNVGWTDWIGVELLLSGAKMIKGSQFGYSGTTIDVQQ